jgi:non-heme chloroperoxidase
MGSLVAQRVAVRAPERVSRIVLIGSFASIVNDETRAFRAELDNLTDPVPVELARDFQMSTLHQPVPEAFLERVIGESLSLPAATWRAVLDGLFAGDDPSLLTRITAPTLILWGELDGFCSRAAQDQLLAAIPSASLIAYPETGHDPHWERPETVARDIAAFLAATPARAS